MMSGKGQKARVKEPKLVDAGGEQAKPLSY